MEQKLVAVLNYDKINNELSTVYKASQLSEDSVLLGVFEKYTPGEETPIVTNYVFFENTNEITNYFQVYYTKVRARELYLDLQGEVSVRDIGEVKTVTYAYVINQSSLTPEQQTDIISQLGLDRELALSAFESQESIRPTIGNQYYYIPQRIAIMKYLDSDEVRDIPVKDLDGDMIDLEEDILYTVDMDRITYDKIDDYDLVYAEDMECYIDEQEATYITDVCYYVLDTSEYYECDETHDWYTEEGVVRDSYTTIARGLFDTEYFICDDCGEIHHLDNMCYDDYGDLTYCESCWSARGEGIIRGYHEGPGLVFYKTEEAVKGGYRFDGGYGFELEVDDSSKSSPISLARDIDDEIEEVWLSHDGSLNDGLEIISHPMTLDYIMNNFDMNQLCDMVKTHGFKSHNTSTCGLQIHASRELFGKDTTEQE